MNTELAEVQAVTADQIKAVLNKYINGKKRVLIEYLPAGRDANAGAKMTNDQ